MSEKKCRVTFEPEGKTVYVPAGTTIYEATGEAGIIINSACGGAGVCGNCKMLNKYYYQVCRIMYKWLNRRSQRRSYNWQGFREMLEHFNILRPRIIGFWN